MLPHRRDPYLWIHLAGLATAPLWLDVCLAGLAVGEPVAPPWLELLTLTLVGTFPILWMQLQRPFYIFSIPGLALRPDQLSEERRRLLTLQRGWVSRGLVVFAAIALWFALYWLYQIAPIATDLPWLMVKSRATGWGICAIAFFCANLFALVPATVAPLFLTSSRRLEQVAPFEAANILSQFMVLGLRVSKILPEESPIVGPSREATAPTSAAPCVSTEPAVTSEAVADAPSSAQSESAEVFNATDKSLKVDSDDSMLDAASIQSPDPEFPLETVDEVDTATANSDIADALDIEPATSTPEPISDAPSEMAVSDSEASLDVAPDESPAPTVVSQAPQDEAFMMAEANSRLTSESGREDPDALAMPLVSLDHAEEVHHAESVASQDPLTAAPTRPIDVEASIASLDELIVDLPEEIVLQPVKGPPSVESDEVNMPKATRSDVG